jgi:hypothetical protein
MHSVQVLLITLLLHYVDDFGAVDPAPLAESSFQGFERFAELIGLKLKTTKRQPPSANRDFLGVVLETGDSSVTIHPKESRRSKLKTIIDNALAENKLNGKAAERLAGKMTFYCSAAFGRVGRAALRPVYRRARFKGQALTADLEFSLVALRSLLESAPPQIIRIKDDNRCRPLLYADAFFEIGGTKLRASQLTADRESQNRINSNTINGWGTVVVRPGYPTLCMRGSLPGSFLEKLKGKLTYIFFLETIAQCLGAWLFAEELGGLYWAFVDNEGARHALKKGYSRDRDANTVVSLFWCHAAARQSAPWFERVESEAQLADGVSRDDWTMAAALGWLRVEPDLTPIWHIVLDAIEAGCCDPMAHVHRLEAAVLELRRAAPPVAVGRLDRAGVRSAC